ncbi:MAG: hypothetical protein U0559_01435 [Anaerolineae bacterium]
MRDDALKAEVERGAGGGIDAHVGLHAADDDARDTVLLEMLEQRRLAETVGIVFLEHDFVFALDRAYVLVNLPADRAAGSIVRRRCLIATCWM